MNDLQDLGTRFRLGGRDIRVPDRGRGQEDGRTSSIWDKFCRVPGAIDNGAPVMSPVTIP